MSHGDYVLPPDLNAEPRRQAMEFNSAMASMQKTQQEERDRERALEQEQRERAQEQLALARRADERAAAAEARAAAAEERARAAEKREHDNGRWNRIGVVATIVGGVVTTLALVVAIIAL